MGTDQVHAKRLAHACEMRLELLAHGECPAFVACLLLILHRLSW